jgi:cell division protein FtsB
MSDPVSFISLFAIVIVAVAGFTWWLRHFIGKERIAALEERLRLAKDKYDAATAETQKLTTVSARLESEVAKLQSAFQSALPSPALRPQLNSLRDTSAQIAKSVTDLSTANNALGNALWVADERSMNTVEGIRATRRSD